MMGRLAANFVVGKWTAVFQKFANLRFTDLLWRCICLTLGQRARVVDDMRPLHDIANQLCIL